MCIRGIFMTGQEGACASARWRRDVHDVGESRPMSDAEVDRRFRAAWEQARAEWAAADPARCAAQAGCGLSPDGATVPFFGRPHLVTHPGGDVSAGGAPAHVAVSILLLHYLLRADGVPPAGQWLAFRELPDGMFYAASFARRAEAPLAQAFGAGSG